MDVLFGLLMPRHMVIEQERLKIVGEHATLGAWKAQKGVEMKPYICTSQQDTSELDPFQLWYAVVHFPSNMKSSPFKFVIEWNTGKDIKHYKWEGEGSIHNRYVDTSLVHMIDTSLLSFLDPEKIKPGSLIKACPLVHWDDVRHRTIEQTHTQAFAKLLNENSLIYHTCILPNLWVGSCPRSDLHIKKLEDMGITHVVTLQEVMDIKVNCYMIGNIAFAECDYMPPLLEKAYNKHNVGVTFLPTKDMTESTKRAAMVPSALLLRALLENKHKVYVHCNCGIGRAIAAITAYLVCVCGWTPETTEYFVGSKRPVSFFDKEGLYLAKNRFDSAFGKPTY